MDGTSAWAATGPRRSRDGTLDAGPAVRDQPAVHRRGEGRPAVLVRPGEQLRDRPGRHHRAAVPGELGQPAEPAVEHGDAGQDDVAERPPGDPPGVPVGLAGGQRRLVEDLVIGPGPVQDTGTLVEPGGRAVELVVDAGCGPRGRPRPGQRDVGLRGLRRVEQDRVGDQLAGAQQGAQPGHGAGEHVVVGPVGLAPAGGRRCPFPPAAGGRVVDGVRVVQGGAPAQERAQPVVGLLQGAAPARGVERLDPGPRVAAGVASELCSLGSPQWSLPGAVNRRWVAR